MEKYLALILLSAPGFIAKFVAQCLGDTPPKRGEFESVLVYSSFSLFSVTLTLILASVFGLYNVQASWSELEKNFSYPIFCIEFLFLSLICSIFVGAAWHLYIENFLVNFFNKLNKRNGKNEVFLEGMLLHKMLNDGEDHFLVVEKDGKEIVAGFFRATSSACADRIELYIASHPEYKEWLDYAKENPHHTLNKVKGVYLDLASGTIIKELEYPPEFLICSARAVQEAAAEAAEEEEAKAE